MLLTVREYEKPLTDRLAQMEIQLAPISFPC